MKIFLKDYIGEEQAGFLPQRQIRDNVRTVVDILEYYDMHPGEKAGLFFVDAEKAFDNLNWDFLKGLVRRMELGPKVLNMIDGIYQNQKTSIIVNNENTNSIPVEKGTRQGCPLSPLLFILVLEVLLREIKVSEEIMGLNIKNHKFKYRAFADDVVFFIQDPSKNLHKLLEKVHEFGNLAGFYINKQKSKILCKNIMEKEQEEIAKRSECVVSKKVKYLGLELTAKNIDLFNNNYIKVWSNIERDMIKWNKLNLSLLGRIAVIKMNVLPRLMYLFQTIPIVKTSKQFSSWQKSITKFIWAGKKPRIKYKILCDAKERGGLQLPNMELYHDAVCLSWLQDWISLKNRKLLALEGYNTRFGWHAYLFYDKIKADGLFKHHVIRSTLINTWRKYQKFFPPERPLWIIPAEVINPVSRHEGQDWLTYKDLTVYKHQETLLLEEKNISFQYGWWRYLQIQDLFRKDKRSYGFRMENSKLEEILIEGKVKTISKIYKVLLEWFTLDEQVKEQMTKWAQNCDVEISLKQWEILWKNSMKISTYVNIKENTFKMIYRWYFTPEKLIKINPAASNKCWKCKKKQGTFYHMWWNCRRAKEYWSSIHRNMQRILKCKINKRPEFFLLGINLNDLAIQDRTLAWYMIVSARILYAQKWKTKEIPKTAEWIQKLIYMAEMDKITHKLRDWDYYKFDKNWEKLKLYLESKWKLKIWNLNIM